MGPNIPSQKEKKKSESTLATTAHSCQTEELHPRGACAGSGNTNTTSSTRGWPATDPRRCTPRRRVATKKKTTRTTYPAPAVCARTGLAGKPHRRKMDSAHRLMEESHVPGCTQWSPSTPPLGDSKQRGRGGQHPSVSDANKHTPSHEGHVSAALELNTPILRAPDPPSTPCLPYPAMHHPHRQARKRLGSAHTPTVHPCHSLFFVAVRPPPCVYVPQPHPPPPPLPAH